MKLTKQDEFNSAIVEHNITKLKKLILNKDVNPCYNNNWAITESFDNRYWANKEYKYLYDNVISLLWCDNRIKESLKINNVEVYNYLLKNEITLKLQNFN
jgi:hypothetical protein